jgi:hypothetical protein
VAAWWRRPCEGTWRGRQRTAARWRVGSRQRRRRGGRAPETRRRRGRRSWDLSLRRLGYARRHRADATHHGLAQRGSAWRLADRPWRTGPRRLTAGGRWACAEWRGRLRRQGWRRRLGNGGPAARLRRRRAEGCGRTRPRLGITQSRGVGFRIGRVWLVAHHPSRARSASSIAGVGGGGPGFRRLVVGR